MEFNELADDKDFTVSNLPEMVKRLALKSDSYPNMLTTLARILAAKPHSADVERCISANNLLKTSLRSVFNMETENAYLFVHHNLPPTAEWDPRQAVLAWLKLKDRRQRNPEKGQQQPYFRNVFSSVLAVADAMTDEESIDAIDATDKD